MLGPVQFVAFEFDSLDKFNGGIVEKLDELTALAAVRILDILFVAKERNGDLIALEGGDFGEEDGDEFLGTVIGELMGFSFEGEDQAAPPDGLGEASAIGVTPDDVRRIGYELAPGSAAALLLIEHRWAAGLRDEILAAGGSMVAQGFLTLEGLTIIGAELTATADAIESIEVATALEVEATLASLQALETIELAREVEAAIVARTVLGLAEAGIIDRGDLADAADAVLETDK
ncbi:MAG: hypothetical protein ACR2QO_21175 [Acidimicrobiales bacterium]